MRRAMVINGVRRRGRIIRRYAGTVNIAAGATTGTVTLALDANELLRTTVEPGSNSGDSGSSISTSTWGRLAVRYSLSVNTLTVTRGISGGTDAIVCAYEILVWAPGVWLYVVRGTITLTSAAAAGTSTIAPIDINRIMFTSLGWTANDLSGENSARCNPRIEVTNLTTITATRLQASSSGAVAIVQGWQLAVEG